MIDSVLARRIDRFGRRAHAFHRFAHHPLCPAYRGEVVAVGRWSLCRGCLLAGAGLACGLLLALALPKAPPGLSWGLVTLWGLWLLALARWRPPKALSRFLPGLLGAFLALQGPRLGTLSGWAATALALAGMAAFHRAYRRRGPHHGPCETCPERNLPSVCTGYKTQTRREKAFRRVVNRWF